MSDNPNQQPPSAAPEEAWLNLYRAAAALRDGFFTSAQERVEAFDTLRDVLVDFEADPNIMAGASSLFLPFTVDAPDATIAQLASKLCHLAKLGYLSALTQE